MAQANKAGIGLILMSSVLMAHAVHAASSVAVQPGLWVGATETTINGKRVPNILDIKGALTAEQKRKSPVPCPPMGCQVGGSQMRSASRPALMTRRVLGHDWSPWMQSKMQSTAGKVRYKAHCELPNENMAPTTERLRVRSA